MKLMTSEYQVEVLKDNMSEFTVVLHGPKESPYENVSLIDFKGVWKIIVQLPENYPYKSPSIGFLNKIFHPNIDERSGTVCLDVINQTWSPMYELKNVFDIFLPQLLLYPNPKDPLNGEAATLLLNDKSKFEQKVKHYVEKFGDLSHVKKPEEGQSSSKDEVKEDDEEAKANDDSD